MPYLVASVSTDRRCVKLVCLPSTANPDIARVPCNARPKGRDGPGQTGAITGSATFVSSNMKFDKTSAG
ncbi:MAG: hypothetical protein WCP86_04590 [bacterium]